MPLKQSTLPQHKLRHRVGHFSVATLRPVVVSMLLTMVCANASPASEPTFALPQPSATFQSGDGQSVALTYCQICHSAEYIYMQPPHSSKTWTHIVEKMQRVFGCPIPEDDIPTLVRYLVTQNTVQLEPPSPSTPSPAASSSASPAASAAKGQTLYTTYCTNCHGQSGRGDGPIGQSINPPAADLTAVGKKSDNDLRATIERGRPGTAMPSWRGDLSDQDITDILAYIRTLNP